MPCERQDNRRLRDHPWIAALFAAVASLFIYTTWIAPHDRDPGIHTATISTPAESNR
jgi:hypothetical protein